MVVIFALFLAWIYHEASERLVEYDEFAVCADSADPCCKSCDNKKNYTDSSYSVGSCASCRPTTGLTSSYSLQKCFDKRNANIADYTSATPSDQALRDIMSCGSCTAHLRSDKQATRMLFRTWTVLHRLLFVL
jgi:hypothetical protein